MNLADDDAELASLGDELRALRDGALALERSFAATLAAIPPASRPSARNLIHYLAVRQSDLRPLQTRLAERGLSSLGRLEPHVLASIQAVLETLDRLVGATSPDAFVATPPTDFRSGAALLATRAEALLGPLPLDRTVRVMVTMPTEAAHDYHLVRELVAAGMDVMRINCAHDQAGDWERMVANARRAERELGRSCRVLCDLAGPKLRTGPMEAGPRVLHLWPLRDDAGRVLARARIRLVAEGAAPPAPGGFTVPIDTALLASLEPGDELHLLDTRGRHRRLDVVTRDAASAVAEADRNAWIVAGTLVELRRDGRAVASGRVGELPPVEQVLRLRIGDRVEVDCGGEPGRLAIADAGGAAAPARVACTLPEAARDVRVGERVFFDDGKIGGVVRSTSERGFAVEITGARSGRGKLRSDRSINLPDTDLALPAVTEKDREDLDFVVRHADLVGLSFARDASDVELLQDELARRGGSHLGVILKVETGQAFARLPLLLLALLRSPAAGVMVARGDLGVELGFERLAEVQEEILWLCEAAQLPVVWATQVLENLAKKGLPSRAEVTDAAMGGRAECVMLNKGPHVADAVRFLCDVLVRMQGHLDKKRSMLRELQVSHVVTLDPRGAAAS